MKHLKMLWFFVLIGLLAGCAGQTPQTDYTAPDLSAKMKEGYEKKVDNFIVILDASSSMFDDYQGSQKFVQARETALNLNSTLPELGFKSGLRPFGPTLGPNMADTKLTLGMTDYASAAYAEAVNDVEIAGVTPLARPLEACIDDLKESPGKSAVIVISDGRNTVEASPVEAAERLKSAYGDNICIYTVLIGDDPMGAETLNQIVQAGGCGFATTGDELASEQGMTDFVKQVFLKKKVMARAYQPEPEPKAKPAPPKDSDGDGVIDARDKCPDTPRGAKVDADGCRIPLKETVTINLEVQFDFDKTKIKPMYYGQIEKAADFLRSYPDTSAFLEGHTDNIGSEKYNINLSKRRAESVKSYMVDKYGIDPSRLATRGYGYSRPVATNKTEAGRQKNRRVVAIISATVEK